jgi:Fe-S cluster assembly scaffold protein SufB
MALTPDEQRDYQQLMRWARPAAVRAINRKHYKIKGRCNRHGINPNDLKTFLDQQHNKCAFEHCSVHETPTKKLNIDHDHKTLKIRGLLCWPHNILLGIARDNPTDLTDAITYLQLHQ